jgi:hypothetical protein
MSTLSSRPAFEHALTPPELTRLISAACVEVLITIDIQVEPAVLKVARAAVGAFPEQVLLLKSAEEELTIADMTHVIDRLGYFTRYEELP